MRQPEPRPAVTSFLSALAADLSIPPDEVTGRRHVATAAATARSAATAGSGRAFRWTAAAVMSTVGLGTGGVALAGGLPAPFQELAADAARVMPFPIAVPYPDSTDVSPPNADTRRRPEDGEVEIEIDTEPIEIGGEPGGETAVTEVSTVGRGPEEEEHAAPVLQPTHDRNTPDSSHRIVDRSVREERADRDRDVVGESRDREQWGRDRSHHDDRGEGQGRRGFPERDGDDEEEPHEDRWSEDDELASEDDPGSEDERHDRD
jgi:hypothetical protein